MRTAGPGPKYLLPNTIGFEKHDVTLPRQPAYSVGFRLPLPLKSKGIPAPKYYIGDVTREGPISKRSGILGAKPAFIYQITPGPNRYAPENHPDPRFKNSPACSIGVRRNLELDLTRTPGAVNYKKPTTIGPQVPDLKASPAYSILGRPRDTSKFPSSPGPGRYGVSPIEAYKSKTRSALILGPFQIPDSKKGIPGPKYKSDYNVKEEAPAYSFGVKHSYYEKILYMPQDKKEFYGF